MMRDRPELSLTIPTYQERDNIPYLLRYIQRSLQNVNHEVIIIDDNSPDGTWRIAEQFSYKFKNFRAIKRLRRMGLSSAVADGFKRADGEVIAVMDADLQHRPELLPEMLKICQEDADLVVASRYVRGGKIEGWSLWRRIVSKGATFLAHMFLPKTRRVRDPMSGYFVFRRKVVEGVKLNPMGCKILLELLVKGKYNRVVEVPCTFKFRSRGRSKLGPREYASYLAHLASLRRGM